MQLFSSCFLALLLLHAASAVPVAENLVRDKRKIEDKTEKPNVEKTVPVVVPADLNNAPKTLEVNEIPAEEGDKQERVKKQAYVKVPCGKSCTPEQIKSNLPDMVILKPDDGLPATMELKPMNSARTFEPIYSFGPVSVNGAAGSAYSSAHASSYGQQTVKPYSSYASPAGLQFHAVIPYMVHRPASHHSYSHSIQTPVQVKPEISYFFDHPEPVYVETEEHGEGHAQQSPVSLYCQSMKSKDLIKQLAPVAPVEAKANATEEEDHDLTVQDHIQRVNEIKDEISQLNQAAQRIVDQQAKLAQLQEEHMQMVSRSAEPDILTRNYPMRIRRPMRPFFRADEESAPSSKEDPHREMMMPQGYMYPYGPYDPYYGYRVAMPAYETGFSMSKNAEKRQDDVEFFMKMLDMGKRMGVLSKDLQPNLPAPVKKEDSPKQENLLGDLAYGEELQKEDTGKNESPAKATTQEEPIVAAAKKRRGVLPKKS